VENKNILAAISLSAAVIVLYSLFFMPEQTSTKQNLAEKKKIEQTTETPKIEKTEIIKKISREDSLKSSERIIFENQNIIGSISLTSGGAIDDLKFKKYNQKLNGEEKIILLSPANVKNGYFLNTGWTTNNEVEVPTPKTVWKTKSKTKLTPNNPVKIYFENNEGIIFERTISIDDNYLFNIDQKIINNSNKSYKFYPYGLIHRNNLPDDLTDFYILHEGYTLLLGDGNIEEVDYDDVKEKKYSKESSSGFLLIGDKYWMTSIIPPQGRKFRFDLDYTNKYRSSYIDMTGYEISPNSSIQHNVKSLLGAKEISLIDQYAEELQIENLDLIVNYGLMYWVVRPLWVVLDYLFKFTSNYGYSIIILTILIRLVFFPLNQFSMRSMAAIKALTPQMNLIKDKYKSDKQQQQKEIMKLYKVNNVNPAASCLPILIQIPIFFSLYKLLLLDLSMRHAPFIWIWEDLAAKDPLSLFNLFGLLPYTVPSFLEIGLLPVMMGGSMWLQMRLSPQATGNDQMAQVQQKMFKFFPLIITIILAGFASGLVLYWTCTNLLTILQQWYLNKTIKVK
tara:strand:+ start:246 stop:1937 length:1692 start_codon:yes stop_codon:yes gene_type:complete